MGNEVIHRAIPIDDTGNYVGPSRNIFTRYSGSGAVAVTYSNNDNYVLVGFKFHMSTNGGNEEFTVQEQDSGYNFERYNMSGEQDRGRNYMPELPFAGGRTLAFAFANSGGAAWSLEIITRVER